MATPIRQLTPTQPAVETMSFDELAGCYHDVATELKLLERQKEKLREALLERLDAVDAAELHSDQWHAFKVIQNRTLFDKAAASQVYDLAPFERINPVTMLRVTRVG